MLCVVNSVDLPLLSFSPLFVATTTDLIYFSLQNSRMIFFCFWPARHLYSSVLFSISSLSLFIQHSYYYLIPNTVSEILWLPPSSCIDLPSVSFPDSHFSYLKNSQILSPPSQPTDQTHTALTFLVLISRHFLSSSFASFQI